MKLWMCHGICLALGMMGVRAAAQELNFRAAVAPMSQPAPSSTSGGMGLSLGAPTALSLGDPVAPARTTAYQSYPSVGYTARKLDEPIFRGRMQEIIVEAAQPGDGKLPPFPPPPPMTGDKTPMYVPPMPGTQPGVPAPPTMSPGTTVYPGVQSTVIPSAPYLVESAPVSGTCPCAAGGDTVVGGFFNSLMGDGPFYGDDNCDGCGIGCFDCGDTCCGPRDRVWFRAEYLLWQISRQNVPPLVTQTNPVPVRNGLGNTTAGIIGLPGTTVVFGDDQMQNPVRNGGMIGLGFWLPRHSDWGFDASFFWLGDRPQSFVYGSGGTPAVGRPFLEAGPVNPGEAAELVANGNELGGTVTIHYNTQVYGGDINLRHKCFCGPNWWVDVLAGYRHMQVNDSLNIREDLVVGANPPPNLGAVPGDRFIVQDGFGTRNTFNGAQIGIEGEYKFWRRLFIGGHAKLAVGTVKQVVDISGSTTFIPVGLPVDVRQGGLLALGTNIGRYSANRFAVLPDMGLTFGIDVTQHVRLYAGVDVMYLSSVVRAGDQIDRVVNTTQQPDYRVDNPVVGAARPTVLFKTTDFWAGGARFGAMIHY